MDLTTITVGDFQAQFFRDFPYLPVWDSMLPYNFGSIVFYPVNGGFYKGKTNGIAPGTLPTVVTAWEPVCGIQNDYVLPQDITNAFAESTILFNQGLFDTDPEITLGFLYLTAHFLVTDLRRSNSGLSSRPELLVESRTVGSLTESYAVPDRFKNDPILNGYLKTGYGMKYLDLILPGLVGNIGSVRGWVNAN